MLSRIVRTINCGTDWFNEEFILWPMKEESCRAVAALNESPDSVEYWYKVVDEDYKLYIGMEA